MTTKKLLSFERRVKEYKKGDILTKDDESLYVVSLVSLTLSGSNDIKKGFNLINIMTGTYAFTDNYRTESELGKAIERSNSSYRLVENIEFIIK